MSKWRQIPTKALPGAKRTRDDQIAEEIVRKLCPGKPADTWEHAFVMLQIRQLRELATAHFARTEPRPSDAKKLNKQIANHAQELWRLMKKLSPDWRNAYAKKKFFPQPLLDDQRYDTAFGVTRFRTEGSEKLRMREWLYYLNQLTDTQGMEAYPLDLKKKCVDVAAEEIIKVLAPDMKLTKTNNCAFYLISSWLWEAISGEHNKSLKRHCDDYIDMIKWFGPRPS